MGIFSNLSGMLTGRGMIQYRKTGQKENVVLSGSGKTEQTSGNGKIAVSSIWTDRREGNAAL